MKASELRIGNWVHFNNLIGMKYDYQVTPRFFRQLALNDPESLDVEIDGFHQPILLTEEWLVKFGFYVLHINKSGVKIYWRGQRQRVNAHYNAFWYKTYNGTTRVKFVHQLQNLYFALTGQELTVNGSVNALLSVAEIEIQKLNYAEKFI